MNEAKILNVMYQYSTEKLDQQKSTSAIINKMDCPRSAEEVFSTGIKLQYLIGDMYLAAADASRGELKGKLNALAMKQLDKKTEIQKLANLHLNEKLTYFYNNGGPIIEAPVSERQAREVNGFYNRIIDNYIHQMELVLRSVITDTESFPKLEERINEIEIRMLTDLANLYHQNEIRMAFKDLINL